MKKEQLLTVMGMFTATGLMMIAIGLLSLPQNYSLSFSQLWQQLWNDRPLFCWVVTSYFSLMFLCDAWVGFGLIYDYKLLKRLSFKKRISKRNISRASSHLGKEISVRGGLDIL
jgi:hypothetical protein